MGVAHDYLQRSVPEQPRDSAQVQPGHNKFTGKGMTVAMPRIVRARAIPFATELKLCWLFCKAFSGIKFPPGAFHGEQIGAGAVWLELEGSLKIRVMAGVPVLAKPAGGYELANAVDCGQNFAPEGNRRFGGACLA